MKHSFTFLFLKNYCPIISMIKPNVKRNLILKPTTSPLTNISQNTTKLNQTHLSISKLMSVHLRIGQESIWVI